jgi:spore germination protein KA
MGKKETPPPPQRAVAEPPTEGVLLGPREGFVESIDSNVALLQKRIKHKDLVFTEIIVGRYTQTIIKVAYIKSIADPEIVKTAVEKIRGISIDGIIDSAYIAEYLHPKKKNPFGRFIKTASTNEKPDIVAAKLLEGRIAILTDGSPVVLSVPYLVVEDLQNPNDYYGGSGNVTIKRIIRLLGGFVAIFLPAIYLGLSEFTLLSLLPVPDWATFHAITPETTNILPPAVEMLLVLILFEIIYEATISMPKNLGSATGLVGAIVLGDVSVSVGLVSAPVVLVCAVSGITMSILPNLTPQIGIMRLLLCVVSALTGLYGVIFFTLLLFICVIKTKSFGVPILSPFIPFIKNDMQDAIAKAPLPEVTKRPKSIPNINPTRAKKK